MMPILASLEKYTQTHFQREEKLQRIAGYPFSDDHRAEHEGLMMKFGELANKAKRANDTNVTRVASEIGTFLEQWITVHVIESDLPMRPFVDRMRNHARGMGRLK